jgi:hypothetical protein
MSAADTLFPIGYLRRSSRARTTSPPRFVVFEMRFTTVSYERNGRPRQLTEMKEKSRCSTLFHLLVPGGKWRVNLPRFCGHPGWREDARGVFDGEEEAKEVHAGV